VIINYKLIDLYADSCSGDIDQWFFIRGTKGFRYCQLGVPPVARKKWEKNGRNR